jgi:hypothetical protein
MRLGGSGLVQQEAARIQSIQTLCRMRREARHEIARLIQFLDASDGYVMTELEDDDDREPVADEEPSLGSFDRVTNQEKSWRAMSAADLDAELDTSDDESALGSLDHDHHPNQEQWAACGRRDLEQDDTESGIGDIDGLLEQVGTHDWQRGGMV